MEKGRIFEALKEIAKDFGASDVELTLTNKKTKEVEIFRYEKEHKCEVGGKNGRKKRKNM